MSSPVSTHKRFEAWRSSIMAPKTPVKSLTTVDDWKYDENCPPAKMEQTAVTSSGQHIIINRGVVNAELNFERLSILR